MGVINAYVMFVLSAEVGSFETKKLNSPVKSIKYFVKTHFILKYEYLQIKIWVLLYKSYSNELQE